MIFYKNGWHIAAEDVHYIQDGEELVNTVGVEGHQWWLDFEEKWDNMTITEFVPRPAATPEQLERLDDINNLIKEEKHHYYVELYVLEGRFSEEKGHPLKELELEQKINELERRLSALEEE